MRMVYGHLPTGKRSDNPNAILSLVSSTYKSFGSSSDVLGLIVVDVLPSDVADRLDLVEHLAAASSHVRTAVLVCLAQATDLGGTGASGLNLRDLLLGSISTHLLFIKLHISGRNGSGS